MGKREGKEIGEPNIGRGSTTLTKAATEQRESVYGSWMTMAKLQRRAPKQLTSINGEEATPPPTQNVAPSALTIAKNRDKIAQ